MTRRRQRAVLLCCALLTIGCDQVTKRAAGVALRSHPRESFLGDTVRLEYVENTGAFLSLGADLSPRVKALVLLLGPAMILAYAALAGLRQPMHLRTAVALSLICAGGASNLVDRAIYGSVVDFLNLGVGSLRTGIFNIADVAIMCGAALAVWRR